MLGALTYDVVEGSLGSLAAGFGVSTEGCLADDASGYSVDHEADPASGQGRWYLMRINAAGGPGSFDTLGVGQNGSRDTGIASSPTACP